MQDVYGHSGNMVMNVLTMPLHLGPPGFPPATVFPPIGFSMLSRPRYQDFLKYTMCKVMLIGIQNSAVMYSLVPFPPILVAQVLVWHHWHHVIASFWTRLCRPLFFSLVFTSSRPWGTCTTADGKVAKSVRCCPLGPWRCFAIKLMVSTQVCSLLSCPRDSLLVVSRLLFLTLRPFAPVCCCNRNPWHAEGWQLCRKPSVSLFSILSVSLHVITCTLWFLAASEEGLFKRCWNLKVVQSSSNCCLTFPPFLDSCAVVDHIFGIRLGALEMCYFLVRWVYLSTSEENESFKYS